MVLLAEIAIYLIIFMFGATIASFINVVIYRVPKKISVVTGAGGRSFCPSCGKTLKPYHLVPIFSYIFLGGKCGFCKKHIPFRYTAVEIIGGALAVISVIRYGFSINSVVVFAILSILVAISYIDYDTMNIYNSMLIALAIPTVICAVIFPQVDIISRIIGAFAISLPLFIITMIIPGSFGGGDIKLMFVGGFLLGWKMVLVAGFIGIVLGGVYGIYLMIIKKEGGKAHMAFGPYLSIGIGTALLYGETIFNWYWNLLLPQ